MKLVGIDINKLISFVGSMGDELKGAIITAIVTGIISIIGFIVTNHSMKKNFKNELLKEKTTVHIEKMSEMPLHILELMEKMTNGPSNQDVLDEFKSILNNVCAYGSVQAIKIASTMQSENYQYANTDQFNTYRALSFYALLITQIKYDVTGIINGPDMWYEMKLTDYQKMKEDIKQENNKIVKELNLNKGFLI